MLFLTFILLQKNEKEKKGLCASTSIDIESITKIHLEQHPRSELSVPDLDLHLHLLFFCKNVMLSLIRALDPSITQIF
jgi:hypothetical protein